ncbi:Mitochondrial translation elongation factor EF-Tsmt, catalyzes nucleotide exchange on EF-Tumt [Ceraceosorus bombacis]|uniref:Mitochondrial translation elongation factor EF-Tsmt, catalyzes nucleotide exchange on EF-Tumt n=1 Tax=Ceraceosorus bombacis TaxID=401625 RepID=A0A0P1BF11_9BASI|nr:Mitochondrial translation elongation factor EF-Tsmt, catalyzes nucleotide exchange on EF-Tumt [Ceraceosorus bombacis]
MTKVAAMPAAGAMRRALGGQSIRNAVRVAPCFRHSPLVASRADLHSSAALRERKPAISSIAELRKQIPGTSMLKAKEAIVSTWSTSDPSKGDDIQAALAWLEEDRAKSGLKKAQKVAGREAKEGWIAVAVLSDGAGSGTKDLQQPINPTSGDARANTPSHAATPTSAPVASIIELNCETDFVGRTDVFEKLSRDIAHSAALFPNLGGAVLGTGFADLDTEQLLDFILMEAPDSASVDSDQTASSTAPTSPRTIRAAILDAVSRLGERIHLSRASVLILTPPSTSRDEVRVANLVGSYVHGSSATKQGSTQTSLGRVGALVLSTISHASSSANSSSALEGLDPAQTRALLRSLARQAVGFQTTSISHQQDQEADSALLRQPFSMLLPAAQLAVQDGAGEGDVEAALHAWGRQRNGKQVQVVGLRRWTLGESGPEAQA